MIGTPKSLLHGTAVAFQEGFPEPWAIFLRGVSGSGKSDLAFRLIEMGARLVCDDQVAFERRHDKVYASPAPNIEGLLEVRGVGLMRVPSLTSARLALVVDLVAQENEPRMPPAETQDIVGCAIPRLKLYPFPASAAAKLRWALKGIVQPDMVI